MNHSPQACALVREFEGCRLAAYSDAAGMLTIGYGHTEGVTENQVCTEEQACAWLDDDLKVADACVNRLVNVKLNQNQFDALVDFVFNVGGGDFQNSSLLKFLNLGQTLMAANEFGRWVHAGSQVEEGLVRRRAAEKALFLKQTQT